MAVLSNTELKKYRNLPYEGREGFRWETFLHYIQKQKPFTCSPQGRRKFEEPEITIQRDSNIESKIQKAVDSQNFANLQSLVFKSTSGQTVKLSDLEKTEDFGKSGGNAGGSEQTAVVEAAQCIVCGALSLGNELTEELPSGDYSVPNASEVWQKFKQLPKDWYDATVLTAKAILDAVGTGKWIFHYGDELVSNILRTFNELKKGQFSGRKDKWNPADIWISSDNACVLPKFNNFDTFSKFCFSDDLKGISLKKGGVNVKECPDRTAEFCVDHFQIKPIGEKAKYLLILFNLKGSEVQKEMYLRPDRDIIKAEVKSKGTGHRNGSCGQGFLSQVLSNLGMREVNLHARIVELTKAQKQDMVNHPGDYDEDLVKGAANSGVDPSLDDPEYEEYFKYNPKELEEYAARQILQEISDFLSEDEERTKTFISKIMRYCVSASENSCSYLKVS